MWDERGGSEFVKGTVVNDIWLGRYANEMNRREVERGLSDS